MMRDPNKAYLNEMLYLPKTKVRKQGIAGALEITVPGQQEPIKLWSEDEYHIVVPRNFISSEKLNNYPFEVIDERPIAYPLYNNFNMKTKLWRKQHEAFGKLADAYSGVLNLGTGKGKTVLALHKIAYHRMPALIVVPNSYLKNQWIDEIKTHIDMPEEDIGVIQGPKFEYKDKAIIVAMIDTLADRVVQGRIPPDFKEHIGLAIYDEVHHLGANHFSKSASVCHGMRIGLSATPERADGLDCIYRYHLGPVFFSDISFDLIPDIEFLETPVEIDLKGKDVVDRYHKELNIPKLMAAVGRQEVSLRVREEGIRAHLQEGRKVIAISQSKEQLRHLHERFQSAGVKSTIIIRETDPEERSRLVKESQVAFVIGSLGLEGLNDVYLESLFFLSPIGGDKKWGPGGIEYLGNRLRQGFGRLLRDPVMLGLPPKQKPRVVFFDDVKVPPLHHLVGQAKKFLDQENLEYTITKIALP